METRLTAAALGLAALAGTGWAAEPAAPAVVAPSVQVTQQVDRPALERQVARAQARLASLPPAVETDSVAVKLYRSQASFQLALAQRLMKDRHQLVVAKALADAAERSMAIVEKGVPQ